MPAQAAWAAVGAGADIGQTQSAIDELTSALSGVTPVTPGPRSYSDVPECVNIRRAETLVSESGEVAEAAFASSAGGVSARIVVFAKKKDAKAFFKLMKHKFSIACIGATIRDSLNADNPSSVIADLDKGKVPGNKKSLVLEGTATSGNLVLDEYEAVSLRGTAIIQASVGEEQGGASGAAVRSWVESTSSTL